MFLISIKESKDIYFQNLFDVLFQNSHDLIVITDKEGIILNANILALRYFGYTIARIKGINFFSFVKDKRALRQLIKESLEKGESSKRLSIETKKEGIIYFDIQAVTITSDTPKLSFTNIVFMGKNVQNIVLFDAQRQFIYDLFQHDLLNKLHAEIGFIDFYKKVIKLYKDIPVSATEMIEKARGLTIKSIYLIQNINILLRVPELGGLTHQSMKDVINQVERYIQSFFSESIKLDLVYISNYYVAGDDYLYRVFVNLMVMMLDFADNNIVAEITVEDPKVSEDIGRIVLHFENVVISDREKMLIMSKEEDLSIKKLDYVVIQTLIDRYHISMKIHDVRRRGETVGTRIVFTIHVARLDVVTEK